MCSSFYKVVLVQNFIVLGMVPGTQVQISFSDWLLFLASTLLAILLARSRRDIQAWLLSKYISRLVKHSRLA